MSNDVIGVIDNPNDADCYKFTVSKTTILEYSISTTNGYELLYIGKDGVGAAAYEIEGNLLKITPGTYYFGVISSNQTYSASSTYSVNFKKAGELADDPAANLLAISKDAGIVFQTNQLGSKYYVNGNTIDINYSYYDKIVNSAGSQTYDIKLRGGDDIIAYLKEDPIEPDAIQYFSSTRPNINVSSRPALALTLVGPKGFYSIHCSCMGAYIENNLWKNLDYVVVIIDPNTGKMIDIMEFNYFYDFAVGSNELIFTRPYDMKFYFNRDGIQTY